MNGEVDWTDTPNDLRRTDSIAILRAGTGTTPALVVLSDKVVGAELHWWNGRSTPHIKGKCPACDAKRPAVWKGYIAVYNPKTHQINILELTPCCIDPLAVYRQTFGSLKGALITLSRPGTKKNGRLTATITPSNFPQSSLPLCPDVRAALVFMWSARRQQDDISYQTPRDVVDGPGDNLELARRRPDRAPPHPDIADALERQDEQQNIVPSSLFAGEHNHPKMSVMFNSDGSKPAENEHLEDGTAGAAVQKPSPQPQLPGAQAKQFTTEGTGVSPVYETTAEQRKMLYRNRLEKRAGPYKKKGDAA